MFKRKKSPRPYAVFPEKYADTSCAADCAKEVTASFAHARDCIQNARSPEKGKNAIIGFEKDGTPLFWNMEQGHLLAVASLGVAMNYLSCALPIFSLTTHLSPDEFAFYYLADDVFSFSEMFPEYCRGESLLGMQNKNEICGRILDELKKRANLNANALAREPFLLVAIGNPKRTLAGADEHLVQEMTKRLTQSGKALRFAFMMMSNQFERDPYYCFYKHAFPFVLLGRCDEAHSLLFTEGADATQKAVMRSAYPWDKAWSEEGKSPWFYGVRSFFLHGSSCRLIDTPYMEIAEYLSNSKENEA